MQFWSYANQRLGCTLSPEDAHDIWECIDLTLRTHERFHWADIWRYKAKEQI